jgi:hypothetical protein
MLDRVQHRLTHNHLPDLGAIAELPRSSRSGPSKYPGCGMH